MPTISNTPRPGYVYDSTDNVWYPIGTGPHTHSDYITQATAINPTIVDAKGDIIAATAADTVSKLSVGANDTVLTADSSTATGLKWAAVAGGVPTGTMLQVASNTAPTGYLKANGSAISRTTYSDLFTAIGTVFGVGDGSTTFNIPDMRGYFTRNWADDYVGADRNRDNGRSFGSAQDSSGLFTSYGSSFVFDSDGTHSTGNYYPFIQQTGSTNNATAVGIRPKNMALLAVIKY